MDIEPESLGSVWDILIEDLELYDFWISSTLHNMHFWPIAKMHVVASAEIVFVG